MSGRGPDIVIGPKHAEATPCAWCGLRASVGLHQGTECCAPCKNGGRVFRVRMSMGRWKRGKERSDG